MALGLTRSPDGFDEARQRFRRAHARPQAKACFCDPIQEMGLKLEGGNMSNSKTINPVKPLAMQRVTLKEVFLNIRLWWLLPAGLMSFVGLIALSIWLSINYNDWSIFERFAAFITVMGSWLVARPVWRRRYKHIGSATLISGNGVTDEQFAEYVLERTDLWFFYSGFFIAAVGSIIWGFGSMFNCFINTAATCPINF